MSPSRRSGNFPETLYKYFSFNNFTERIFSHSEVYFPSPKQFNDPFDCKVRVDFRSSPKEQREFLDEMLAKLHPSLTKKQRQPLVKKVLREKTFFNNREIEKFTRNMQDTVDAAGVFCMTELPDNILMWAHYADSHRGFCAEFAVADNRFFGRTIDVNYSSTYIKPHFLHSTPREQVEEILLTKALPWSYEREWRIIDQLKGCGAYKFPAPALRTVILGCRMSSDNEARIRTLLSSFPSAPVLKRAKPSDSEFSLDLVPA